jgi:threonine/homoserine/homoserine lactone efflux protein
LAAGVRRRHAGAWIAVGHGIVEFPLMVLIVLGVGAVLQARWFNVTVGLAGGATLLLMGGMMIEGLRRNTSQADAAQTAKPLWTGIVLTACNPFFLLWWATVGLKLTTQAVALGVLAFALFAVIHWLCDLVWLEAISLASHRGVKPLGPRSQKVVLALCGATMAGFGVYFLWVAIGTLRS